MPSPIISICVAAYNVEDYISECLESIIRYEKTVKKEIIIVNDCSTDATVSTIQKIVEKYPKESITLIHNTHNLGPGASYNIAAQHASGQYITFLDSDDFLIDSGLQEKLDMLERYGDMQIIYGNGKLYEAGVYTGIIQNHIGKIFAGGLTSVGEYIQKTIPMLSVSCSLIRKDFFDSIGGFDPVLQSNDWVLNLKIFNHIDSINQYGYSLRHVFAYRIHANNISKDQDRMKKLLLEVIDAYIPERYKKIGYANVYFFVALNLILQSKHRESVHHFYRSIAIHLRVSRICIYLLAFISPVGYIARNYPTLFVFLKKSIQKFFS